MVKYIKKALCWHVKYVTVHLKGVQNDKFKFIKRVKFVYLTFFMQNIDVNMISIITITIKIENKNPHLYIHLTPLYWK